MNGYEGPLDIPLLGDLIAQAVEGFARDHDLQYDLWYHNEPVWLVWREVRGEGYTQEVQIAAFRTKEGEYLFFIPQAYRFEEETVHTTPPAAGNIVQRPLRDFCPLTDIPTVIRDVQELVAQAWSAVEAFKKIDVTHQL